jgi:hypothetical protein
MMKMFYLRIVKGVSVYVLPGPVPVHTVIAGAFLAGSCGSAGPHHSFFRLTAPQPSPARSI